MLEKVNYYHILEEIATKELAECSKLKADYLDLLELEKLDFVVLKSDFVRLTERGNDWLEQRNAPMVNRTLSFLIYCKDTPIQKGVIARHLGTSESYISKPLATLSNADYIYQAKGYYRVTPKGIKAFEEDPVLSSIMPKRGRPISKPQTFTDILDWEHIKKCNVCCFMINNIGTQIKEGDKNAQHYLMPMVIMYLASIGQAAGAIAMPNEAPDDYDREHLEAIQLYVNSSNSNKA